jgi:hypothetical protein
MTPANEEQKVSRADIEAKLQQIKHVTARVLVRAAARPQEEHHRRDPSNLMARI